MTDSTAPSRAPTDAPDASAANAPAADAQRAGDGAGSGARLLGLPTVARLARFVRHEGPALLLTSEERAERFTDADPFGVRVQLDPDLDAWPDRAEKVVLTVPHALRAFPRGASCSIASTRSATRATRRPGCRCMATASRSC